MKQKARKKAAPIKLLNRKYGWQSTKGPIYTPPTVGRELAPQLDREEGSLPLREVEENLLKR